MEIEVYGTKILIEEDFIEDSKEEIKRQLEEYFEGERTSFNLEIKFPDSFTGSVMKKMSKIPYGETRSYGELAEELDTAAIAVGQACGRNPVPVIVPCHRIVGTNSPGGYAHGEKVKQKLLAHESREMK